MIVQLVGGIFDGAETEVRGDEERIAILINGANRYALYTKHPELKYRYCYQRTTRGCDVKLTGPKPPKQR